MKSNIDGFKMRDMGCVFLGLLFMRLYSLLLIKLNLLRVTQYFSVYQYCTFITAAFEVTARVSLGDVRLSQSWIRNIYVFVLIGAAKSKRYFVQQIYKQILRM